MSILQYIPILLKLFSWIPPDLLKSVKIALAESTAAKQAIQYMQSKGLLDWTGVDEKIIQWIDTFNGIIGIADVPAKEYLSKLTPDSLNAELAHMAAITTQQLHGKELRKGIAKMAVEIIYNKMKRAD